MNKIICGDALSELQTLPDQSVQSCITSPPYYGLRDYGTEEQIGLESSPEEYIERLVSVFREVRRVLKEDGTLWLNLGDSYAHNGAKRTGRNDENENDIARRSALYQTGTVKALELRQSRKKIQIASDLPAKNLLGIPWRVAFALQADGWILRSDIIWHKPNCMPESVKDRPTKSHEYLFLLAKNEHYYYDSSAIQEKILDPKRALAKTNRTATNKQGNGEMGKSVRFGSNLTGKNKRSVWEIATQPYKEAHFAVMPQKLIEPCVLASSQPGDLVLDPFAGSGTVPFVAARLGRQYLGIELNSNYIQLIEKRLDTFENWEVSA